MKKYLIPPEEIKPLLVGRGLCMVPDTILVTGLPLQMFYRVMPSHRQDSGWRFLAGTETPEYLANPLYSGLYDLNIIANYFPEIIPHLDDPPYTAYEKIDGEWVDVTRVTDWAEMA